MFELVRSSVPLLALVFVIATMLNVGLTQKPADIISHLKELRFVFKMLLANFVLAPLVMVILLRLASFEPDLDAGLLLFGLCAGAPFLIKLTQMAEHEVALGAALMLLLMVVTVAYAPLVLPLVLTDIEVDGGAVAKTLLVQTLLPTVFGMLAVQFVTGVAKTMQPWVGKLGNFSLYALVIATLVGYFPNMLGIFGTGAIFAGLAFVLVAFGIGYLMGSGRDHHEDIGGLATAQRNTAAAIIIATQNFSDRPNVLVMLTLANVLGVVMLLGLAKLLSRDNKVSTQPV